MTDERYMKTERIKEGEIYMAVIKGNEIRVLIDTIHLDHVAGTDIDKQRGIIVPTAKIVAGPLRNDSRLSEGK